MNVELLQILTPIIIAMIGSQWFGSWIISLKSPLRKVVMELKDDIEQDRANNARARILRFDDELRIGIHHSQEYYDEILSDIDKYDAYCRTHAGYPNSKATMAIAHIKETYQLCIKENKFL